MYVHTCHLKKVGLSAKYTDVTFSLLYCTMLSLFLTLSDVPEGTVIFTLEISQRNPKYAAGKEILFYKSFTNLHMVQGHTLESSFP